MLRFATVLALCAELCLAQTSSRKPPAGVDKELRARVNQFFQLLVDAKYRQAEALVAEDSKDAYYDGQKPKFLSYEVKSIEYSNEFTHARVMLLCQTLVAVPGFAGTAIKVSVGSDWKLVNGEWYWWVDPETARHTPFGPMNAGPGPRRPPGMPAVLPTDPGFVLSKVKADKTMLKLHAGETGEVRFTNSADGQMSISLMGKIPGVDVKMDRLNIDVGGKAVLSVTTHPDAQSGTLSVQVEQTGEVIPIQVQIE